MEHSRPSGKCVAMIVATAGARGCRSGRSRLKAARRSVNLNFRKQQGPSSISLASGAKCVLSNVHLGSGQRR